MNDTTNAIGKVAYLKHDLVFTQFVELSEGTPVKVVALEFAVDKGERPVVETINDKRGKFVLDWTDLIFVEQTPCDGTIK